MASNPFKPIVFVIQTLKGCYLSFSKTQAELAKLPNSVKIKNYLIYQNLKFISFWNVLNTCNKNILAKDWVLGVTGKYFSKVWRICQIHFEKLKCYIIDSTNKLETNTSVHIYT